MEHVTSSNKSAQALLDDFENVRLSAAGTTSTAQERRARDEAIWKKYNNFREQPTAAEGAVARGQAAAARRQCRICFAAAFRGFGLDSRVSGVISPIRQQVRPGRRIHA